MLYNIKWFFIQINKVNFLKVIFFFLIIFSIFIFIAQNIRLEWDGHVWMQKALIFYNNHEISKLNDTVMPNYPYLGSYIWAFFWKNSLLELEYFGRYFYVYFYIVSIFLILKVSSIKNGFIKSFLILFLILITFEPYYLGGYQEYLIFSTLLIASRYIFLFNSSNLNNIRLIILIFFLLYINCWFKNEGVIYFVIFSGGLIYFSNININKKILFIFMVFLLLLIQYLTQKYLIKNLGTSEIQYLINSFYSFGDLKFLIIKIFKIFAHSFIAFVKHPLWIIVLLSLFFQIFILKKIDNNTRYFLVCLILNIGIIFVVYIGLGNLDLNLRVTLDRVLFQTSGFYLVLFFGLFNSQKIKL
jgi:hypothetical protein